MSTFGSKNLFILSFTMLVVMLGYSMAMPLLPFYIQHFGVGGTELGWLMATYSLMQLICAPIWGVVSDRYGRKPILAIGILGYAITLFLFGLAKNFTMLFLARTLSGILSSATQPTAMAYIGESTEQIEKSKGMGQLGAMVGLGVILGPLFGGLLSTDSLSLPFLSDRHLLSSLSCWLSFFCPNQNPPFPRRMNSLPMVNRHQFINLVPLPHRKSTRVCSIFTCASSSVRQESCCC